MRRTYHPIRRSAYLALLAALVNVSAEALPPPHEHHGDEARAGMRSDALPVEPDATTDIRETLARLVEAALREGDFNRLLTHFAKGDRVRLSLLSGDAAYLNKLIRSLHDAWRERYTEPFELDTPERQKVLFDLPASRFAEDPRRVMLTLPGETTSGSITLPPVTLEMVNEGALGDSWKLDVPDLISSGALRLNLEEQLVQLIASTAVWPRDADTAAKLITHSILLACNKTGSPPI
jgi:hypothetical protein